MRKLFDAMEGRIRSFIAQRSDLAMVVRCSEPESPVVLKIVETVSESSHSNLFRVFSEEFGDPQSYASVLTTGFVVKHEAVRLAMAEKGIPPLVPAPQSLLDPALPPVRRLREMMLFGRSLLAAPEGCHSVWGLFPVQIRDPRAYALLLA